MLVGLRDETLCLGLICSDCVQIVFICISMFRLCSDCVHIVCVHLYFVFLFMRSYVSIAHICSTAIVASIRCVCSDVFVHICSYSIAHICSDVIVSSLRCVCSYVCVHVLIVSSMCSDMFVHIHAHPLSCASCSVSCMYCNVPTYYVESVALLLGIVPLPCCIYCTLLVVLVLYS